MSKMVLEALGMDPASAHSFGEPVEDIATLTSLKSSILFDKQMRLVESVGSIYRFDKQSVVASDGTKVIRPADIAVPLAGRWHLLSISTHALLEGLTGDDHTQYIHKDIARTIAAVHTFNPVDVSAPFILGAKAVGQKVIGLNADMLDGKSIEDFVTLKLANGMPAYLDPVSKTTLSVTTVLMSFGLPTSSRNVYLNSVANISSSTLGIVIPRNAMLVAASVASSAVIASGNPNVSFQLRRNGETSGMLGIALPSGSKKQIYPNARIALNAGDEIQAYISAGSSVANPVLVLELAWRD